MTAPLAYAVPGTYTQEGLELRGYRFEYVKHYGRTVYVNINRAVDGVRVRQHFHTQGVIGAFNRLRPGEMGRMSEDAERAAIARAVQP